MRRLVPLGLLAVLVAVLSGCAAVQDAAPRPSGSCRSNVGAAPWRILRAAAAV